MPTASDELRARPSVYLFLDESGTSSTDNLTMIGCTAFQDVVAAEQAIKRAYDRAIGNPALWISPEKRDRFAAVGFHFTEDSESVRQEMLSVIDSLQFRAYAAYAKNDGSQAVIDLLTTMYGTLLTSVLARYRDSDLTLVFEENSAMDSMYSKIWHVLVSEVWGLETARALRGTKKAPCLAVTDYVLGVTRVHLSGGAENFQKLRFRALGRNLAYLLDFDDDRHLGGRKHPIV